MKRPSTVSQNVRIFIAAAALAVGAAACGGGGNDKTGTAGAGAGGTSGTACTLAQVNTIFAATTHNCTLAGACHDAVGSAAGLDLTSAGWQNNLVGKGPTTTGGVAGLMSLCAGMNRIYLNAGSNPATGLFMDKLNPATPTPPCGAHMPNLGTPLTATEYACVGSFATTLTNP